MLARRHRMTRSSDFALATRRGRRAKRGSVLVYGYQDPSGCDVGRAEDRSPLVGLVVSRQVGNAVVRHRVARVLRHEMARHVSDLPNGSLWVLRALPAAGRRPNARIANDLTSGVRSLVGEDV